jgi:glutamate racemase
MDSRAIGVFDSGLGGLTVVKQIIKALPSESIIYLGDTARVPYGTRDRDTITKFALELTKYLIKHDVKYLVVACNTISATCLEEIEELSPVPVIGVIKPAAKLAVETTKNKRVGVIGTRATVHSGAYTREMRKIKDSIEVFAEPCPLFVPIIEEGLMQHQIAEIAVAEYLLPYQDNDLDTMILGCTHYPMLRDLIQKKMGSSVKLIDSAKPTAQALKLDLKERGLLNSSDEQPVYKLYLTDTPLIAKSVINIFFEGDPPTEARKIEL